MFISQNHLHIHQEIVGLLQISLLEANSHRQNSVWVKSIPPPQASTCSMALLMNNVACRNDAAESCRRQKDYWCQRKMHTEQVCATEKESEESMQVPTWLLCNISMMGLDFNISHMSFLAIYIALAVMPTR